MSDKKCVFCSVSKELIVAETELLIAFKDKYPVTPNHLLIVPKAHRNDYFALTPTEASEVQSFLAKLKRDIQSIDPSVNGFNIGMNCGESAGQTVFHCHIHLIPRRPGDVDDPWGGVRGVIPEKQKYPTTSQIG